MQRNRFQWLTRLPVLIGLILALGLLWQHQAVMDWLKLRAYSAPSSVVRLADQTTMTARARHVFYVNRPAVDDRPNFNKACSNSGEHTIILGCYHPVDNGIFIFNVSDSRLDGVDQVTAAHEMLHAAYDRLSSRDRTHIDGMLNDYYTTQLKDDRIKTIIAAYQKSEPGDVVNEMHSIFGTEVGSLPRALEQYYSEYFHNRSRVVAYANAYQAEFTSRQATVTDYDSRLKTMKSQINTDSGRLDTLELDITSLRNRMQQQKTAGNIEAYNANVSVYNAKIDTYNALITSTKSLIASYNQQVNERNALALQVTELAHSIDSSFTPIQQK